YFIIILFLFFFFLSLRPPPISTLFPYTTLFRSPGLNSPSYTHWLLPALPPAASESRPFLSSPSCTFWGLCLSRCRARQRPQKVQDRKSTRLNSSHLVISYAVFCLKKKKNQIYI